MHKKIAYLLSASLLVVSSFTFAASKKGIATDFFIGGETGSESIKYQYGENALSANLIPFEIIAGARFYFGKFGFGVKTLAGSQNYSNTVGKNNNTAEGLKYGIEGLLYADFIKFAIMRKESAIGVTVGEGYEKIEYSNIRSQNPDGNIISYLNYSDPSSYHLIALHFKVGSNRFEVGYKDYQHFATTLKTNSSSSYNPQKIGFIPEDKLYAAYSFSF